VFIAIFILNNNTRMNDNDPAFLQQQRRQDGHAPTDRGAGQIMDDSKSGSSASVGSTCWDNDLYPSSVILAFRIIKEHKEPREFWVVDGFAYDDPQTGYGCIHVREVLE
jgi:hypothetical protein